MAIRQLDVFNILTDPRTRPPSRPKSGKSLANNAEWTHLVEEYSDVVNASVGHLLPIAQTAAAGPESRRAADPVQVRRHAAAAYRRAWASSATSAGTPQTSIAGNQLFMVTLRSPHPHARVRSIDSTDAEKFPGVPMVLHRFNLPREYQRIKLGSGPPDRLLFPEEIFMVGTPVAIVLADSQDIGDEAMRLIKVEYEILPAAVNFLDARSQVPPSSGTTSSTERSLV